jgi:hypothetical protein
MPPALCRRLIGVLSILGVEWGRTGRNLRDLLGSSASTCVKASAIPLPFAEGVELGWCGSLAMPTVAGPCRYVRWCDNLHCPLSNKKEALIQLRAVRELSRSAKRAGRKQLLAEIGAGAPKITGVPALQVWPWDCGRACGPIWCGCALGAGRPNRLHDALPVLHLKLPQRRSMPTLTRPYDLTVKLGGIIGHGAHGWRELFLGTPMDENAYRS